MSNSVPIAFIGTGVMGRSIAAHLQSAGHPLHVHNRTKEKAQPLIEAGAQWHETAGSAAAEAAVVFSMVGYPADVEQTYFRAGEILDSAQRYAILVDLTTSSPQLAVRIAATARGRTTGRRLSTSFIRRFECFTGDDCNKYEPRSFS